MILILLALATFNTALAGDSKVKVETHLNLLEMHKAGIIDTDEDEIKWRVVVYDIDTGKTVHKSELLLTVPWALDDADRKTSAGVIEYSVELANKDQFARNLRIKLIQEVGIDDTYDLGDVTIFDASDNSETGSLKLTNNSKVIVDFE